MPAARMLFWTKARTDLLGTVPDAELAERWGIKKSAVTARRNSIHRPAYRKEKKELVLTEDMMARLGKEGDGHLAKEWGVGLHIVRQRRVELGIKGFRGGRQKSRSVDR